MLSRTEYDLMCYVAEFGPLTVRQITETFGEDRGYTRGTITQMVDRLMKKKRLTRETVNLVFEYSSVDSLEELRSEAVSGFVNERFGGEVKPLVAYLTQAEELSVEEYEALKALVDSFEDRKE